MFESKTVEIPEKSPDVVQKTIMQELLEQTPDKYTFFNTDTGYVAVVKHKVRVFTDPLNDGSTSIFIDENSAVEICDPKAEEKILGEMYNIKIARCRPNIVTFLDYSESAHKQISNKIKTPVDWMEEFQYLTPFNIDNSTQMVHARSINPTLSYNRNGVVYTFKIDQYYNIPIRIEISEPKQIITFDLFPDFLDDLTLDEDLVTPPQRSMRELDWIKDHKIIIRTDNQVGSSAVVEGYISNNDKFHSFPGQINVTCYNKYLEEIGQEFVSIPTIYPSERYQFSRNIPIEGTLYDCRAEIV